LLLTLLLAGKAVLSPTERSQQQQQRGREQRALQQQAQKEQVSRRRRHCRCVDSALSVASVGVLLLLLLLVLLLVLLVLLIRKEQARIQTEHEAALLAEQRRIAQAAELKLVR